MHAKVFSPLPIHWFKGIFIYTRVWGASPRVPPGGPWAVDTTLYQPAILTPTGEVYH